MCASANRLAGPCPFGQAPTPSDGVAQALDKAANGGGGDSADDIVTIQGTKAADVIHLSMQSGALVVDGLAAQIVVQNFEIGDRIQVLGLGGDDIIDASALAVNASIVLDGGEGDD